MKKTEWVTSVDLAGITFADLLGLQRAMSAVWEAKLKWAQSGGKEGLAAILSALSAISRDTEETIEEAIAEMRAHSSAY